MNICMDIVKKEKYHKIVISLLSFATVCGITLNLDMSTTTEPGIIKYLSSMNGFSMVNIVLFFGICMAYHFAFSYLEKFSFTLRDKIWIGIPAFLFANFMPWGYSFEATDSYILILGSKVQMLKSCTMAGAYFILFSIGIACLYKFLDCIDIREKCCTLKNAYAKMFYQHPFLTPFVTMLICYIPCMVLTYPAVVMGDTRMMISEGYNLPSSASKGAQLLDPNVLLTGHHAVFYPVFMHICIVIGKAVFGSFNAGIFLVALIQLIVSLTVISYTLQYMIKQRIRFGIVLAVMLYYIFSPRIQSYQFLITKDVLCACAMLLFVVSSYRVLKEQEKVTWKRLFLLFISAAGVEFFRNDGKYIVLLSFFAMLLFFGKKCRRQLLAVSLLSVVVVYGFFSVVMPALHITPVTSRVLYSVPFQQTARYIRDYGDEVTEEEKEAISKVLSYDNIADKYYPRKSDPVKALYNPDVTKQEMAAYLKVWWKMFLKHPGVYVSATMNNYFYYFYPGKAAAYTYSFRYSEYLMDDRINSDRYLQEMGMDIHYPDFLDGPRLMYESLREHIFSLPVLNLFKCSAAFVWVIMLLACYLLRRGKWNLLAVTTPMLLCILVCIVSPCNGDYFRYLYSVVYCLPAVIIFGLNDHENSTIE